MTDGGLWNWGDPGMPQPDKDLGDEIRRKACAATAHVRGIIAQTPPAGIDRMIASVRREAAVETDDQRRKELIAARYATARAADIAFLTQLVVHSPDVQDDQIAPLVPQITARLSTIQGARALQAIIKHTRPNTASRQRFNPNSKRLWFSDAVRGLKGMIHTHVEEARELFGSQCSIEVCQTRKDILDRGLEVVDQIPRARRSESLVQEL